jgi:GNAT superfamily N-acetyltransferase
VVGSPSSSVSVIAAVETFYDAVPRRWAAVEEHGPFQLFVRKGSGWPFYARPVPGWPVGAADVEAVRRRQRELGVPEEFEWVHEVAPSVLDAATGAGLRVRLCPLMVLRGEPAEIEVPASYAVKLLQPDDADLAGEMLAMRAVAEAGFAAPGVGVGPTGVEERDAVAATMALMDDEALAVLRTDLAGGHLARALAVGPDGPVACGTTQRAGDTVEVAGVATLPAYRRKGLGAAVTAALTLEARGRGATVILLSAGETAVARIYERVGFTRIGTACMAAPT